MYALPLRSSCPGDDSNNAEETPRRRTELPRPVTQDCSNFDIVKATQVYTAKHDSLPEYLYI